MDFELPSEEKRLQEETRAFVDREIRPLVPDIETRKKKPIEIVRRMARQGIFRLLVPKEYGGTYETVRSLPMALHLIFFSGWAFTNTRPSAVSSSRGSTPSLGAAISSSWRLASSAALMTALLMA